MTTKTLTILVAGLVALTPAAAYASEHALTPAAAHAEPHHDDTVRYVSIKGCPMKGGGTKPCGPWRIGTHGGGRSVLHDAQGVARKADGTSSLYYAAPVAVSGNGRRLAYFTKPGRLAVRTVGGGVRLLAKDALPRVAQWRVSLRLSDDGGRLAALVDGSRARIFDTATGARLGTLPAGADLQGFSGDGDELLASAAGDESVTDLVVYSDTGERLLRVTPPQVIGTNTPQALAADGRTVASVVTGKRPELVTYDVATDQVIGRTKVTLPAGGVEMVDWTGETQVTVHLVGANRMTIVEIDTETGTTKVRDRYRMPADAFVFAACGG
ncbi:hypothetical protein [Nonomuraea sp. NPDC002799]